nr:DUF6443 domain-containing protein [uncultured Flavobacterium sp.]
MKIYISLLILLLLSSVNLMAQNLSNDNFIYTAAPQKAVQAANYNTLNPLDLKQNVTYFDGLGRPIQQIAHQQSGSGKDIVTPIEYDAFGRQPKDYLSYVPDTSAALNYKTTALTDVFNFPQYLGQNPFSEKAFEASPLNRILKQAAPGADWKLGNGHEIKLDYQTNTTADAVKLFSVTTSWNATTGLYDIPTSLTATPYADSQLYKNITFDENTIATPTESNGSTVEFKNKEGQVVLKRTYEANIKHDTYYVYDQYNNLTFVLPPLVDATTTISNTILNDLCYQYKYDYRNRLVEKKLPGKQWEYILYDKLDRPVATGPVFSPFSDSVAEAVGWMITKYDVFNRPIYTGWELSATITSAVRKTKQTVMDSLSTISESKTTTPTTIDSLSGIAYYTNTVAPTSFKLLTINYYDDYNFQAFTPTIAYTAPVAYNNSTLKPKGLPTGTWVRVLSTLSATTAESSYILYDAKARPVKTFSTNYLGGYTQINSNLDAFSGRLNYTETRHKRTSDDPELYVKEAYTYSAQDRLMTHTHQIGISGTPQLLASNTYNELGQLISKNVGNTAVVPLQKVDYAYNIRGWLTGINNDATNNLVLNTTEKDLFGFKINYNTIKNETNYTGQALYNGNISETYWRTASDNVQRKYGYKYDNLNRLKNAIYQKPGNAAPVPQSYDENLSYDKNGNVMTLSRNGDIDGALPPNGIDNLVYTYAPNTNKLLNVLDNSNNNISGFVDANKTGDDYSYDTNGNMITDKNKHITSIIYNHLNLPTLINFYFPSSGYDLKIEYIYNAVGQKLQKIVFDKTASQNDIITTDYLGGFQYKSVVSPVLGTYPSRLQFFPTAEGYVKNTVVSGANTYSYVFNYTDHLGNVRLSYSDADKNGVIVSSEILDESHYYPFGLKHAGYVTALGTDNKYKFNDKELQDELGLNVYFFKFRSYDPALGRFWQIDPLAGTYAHNSTYAYAENNVSSATDLEGLEQSFHLNGNLATAQNGPRVTGGVNGNYTLQELKSHMAQKQAQTDRAMNKLMSGDPRSIPSGDIRPAKGDINVARFDDPGMMIADGARIGAEMMATDVAIGKVFQGFGALSKGRNVWMANAFERGRRIETMLGENLGWNFPTIDKIKDGVATSIKSMDLTAGTYQKGNSVLNTLKGYINKLDGFTSATWGGQTVTEGVTYTSKSLELAVQTGKGSESQWSQIADAIKYAQDKNINVTIRFIK